MVVQGRVAVLLSCCLGFAVHPARACADMGPKPTMDFHLETEGKTITAGRLFECEKADCSDEAPLRQMGPQGFGCSGRECGAMAYGFEQYHRLELTLSDGDKYRSEVFETAGFAVKYRVEARRGRLVLEVASVEAAPARRWGMRPQAPELDAGSEQPSEPQPPEPAAMPIQPWQAVGGTLAVCCAAAGLYFLVRRKKAK